MMNKILYSILFSVLVWVLGVSFYLLSFYVPILENPNIQSNIALALGVIPSSCLGVYLFYKKSYLKPALLALTFVIVAATLDAIITVPVFIEPNGGSYSSFYKDPMFYIIALELYFIAFYFGIYLNQNKSLEHDHNII